MASRPASRKISAKAKAQQAAGMSTNQRYIIDFTQPANDRIFDAPAFEKFLRDRIKVDGRTGQLEDKVSIQKEGEGKLVVTTTIPFSKRYLKYLTKKFLKKNQMREWLRVISTNKNTYELKFFNVNLDEPED